MRPVKYRWFNVPSLTLAGVAVAVVFAVTTLNRSSVETVQNGYRGTGMQIVYNPNVVSDSLAGNQAPALLPVNNVGPYAGTVYKNLGVLQNVRLGSFLRLMQSMTLWVAPSQGCNYCHVNGNFASNRKYTKRVAYRMIQMVIATNSKWKNHVKNVGVTCYTCHRGANIPRYVWFNSAATHPPGIFGDAIQIGHPDVNADLSELPGQSALTDFLLQSKKIADNSVTALPSGDRQSILQTEWTYALMMHFSTSLGVNCAFCHNTRAISQWRESTPNRVTAFYGLRMTRELNNKYMLSLTSTFPAALRGPTGDVAKINCSTCHQGVYKPLYGANMVSTYPMLEQVQPAGAGRIKAASP
jgi:photosynthetic reaction center cytochrome c subunit